MRELGVGLVYWSALDSIVNAPEVGVAVVEIEPQSLWEKCWGTAGWHYRQNDELLGRIAALTQPKLLHGVGHPVGGTASDTLAYWPLLQDGVARLNPIWCSEHLSFNRALMPAGIEHAGFLLPPPQTVAAARVAANNLRQFRSGLRRPVAFETGVNYLRPQAGDLGDGEYFRQVAEGANCGIVLDLHNLWCNERNGRSSMRQVLAQLPLERVWEIHFAGGMWEDGYWLDAHSGAIPLQVMELASELLPKLPNVGALIYEVLPEHLPSFGLDAVQRELEALQRLWLERAPHGVVVPRREAAAPPTADDVAQVAHWERELVGALRSPLPMIADPGIKLLQKLIGEFRCSNLARTLHYTLSALLAGMGAPETNALLAAYCAAQPPEPFAALEAEQFAKFLRSRFPLPPTVPFLDEVLSFEHALARASVYGSATDLHWSADPVRIFDALDAGRLPSELPRVSSTMRVSCS